MDLKVNVNFIKGDENSQQERIKNELELNLADRGLSNRDACLLVKKYYAPNITKAQFFAMANHEIEKKLREKVN